MVKIQETDLKIEDKSIFTAHKYQTHPTQPFNSFWSQALIEYSKNLGLLGSNPISLMPTKWILLAT